MRHAAFTLIEMLIVVGIIAMLALLSSAFSTSSIDRAYFTQIVSLVMPLSTTSRIQSFKTGTCLVQGITLSDDNEKIDSYKYTSGGSLCYLWVRLSLTQGPDSMRGKVIRLSYPLDMTVPPQCVTSVEADKYNASFCQYDPTVQTSY